MEYVMVPVPEELAEDVARFVRAKSEPPPEPPPDYHELLVETFRALDTPGRQLLWMVSESVEAEAALTISELASQLGWTERELLGTMVNINLAVFLHDGPPFALLHYEVPGADKFSFSDRVMGLTPAASAAAKTARQLGPIDQPAADEQE